MATLTFPPKSSGGKATAAATPPRPAATESDSGQGVAGIIDDAIIRRAIRSRMGRRLLRIGREWSSVVINLIMALICAVCFFVRLFAVVRHESVIHEFDPYFNYRTTRYLAREGFHEFWNWWDAGSWYPLGRPIGHTLFPGLMTTAATLHYFLNFCGMKIDIKDVCVFLAPIFSAFTSIAAFLLTKEVTGRAESGLLAAILLGLSPAHLSRSVAGSYDNEAVAIFALVFSFYVVVKALNSRTMLMSMFAALAYFYMVASWGGYVFITNVVSIFFVALTVLGRLKPHHYVVFCVFYVIGTVLCLNIPFVNFSAVHSSEHMASHGAFLLLNAYWLGRYLKGLIHKDSFAVVVRLFVFSATASFLALFLWLSATGRTAWTGRSMTLLDPTYAAKHIPIIASVSEHQATIWSSYIFDINFCILLVPIGLWVSFTRKGDGYLFVGIYAVLAVYFSGVMVRLMLILAPAACVMAAIGLSFVLSSFFFQIRTSSPTELLLNSCRDEAVNNSGGVGALGEKCESSSHLKTESSPLAPSSSDVSSKGNASAVSPSILLLAVGCMLFMACGYITHGVFASAMAYSHPSIVHSQHLRDGTRMIQDDFREAFYWFRKNTHPDAKLMSWWDYGYQTCTMGNRTVHLDNNTWNNTHIATVGLALASPEEEAYPILLNLDVDYIFIVFGGIARYSGDDINKFLWIIRIASGVYPQVQEHDFYSAQGQYKVGKDASPAMVNSIMYKFSYYRFAQVAPGGMDPVRNDQITERNIQLKHFEEAYTTQNWMVRIYKVKKPPNRVPVQSRWK